jgi:hypothetical protein
LTLDVDGASPALLGALRAQPFVRSVDVASAGTAGTTLRLRLAAGGDHRREISAIVAEHGGLITGMRQEQLSLEDAFVRLTADNVGVAAGRRLAGPAADERPRGAPTRAAARASRRSKAR